MRLLTSQLALVAAAALFTLSSASTSSSQSQHQDPAESFVKTLREKKQLRAAAGAQQHQGVILEAEVKQAWDPTIPPIPAGSCPTGTVVKEPLGYESSPYDIEAFVQPYRAPPFAQESSRHCADRNGAQHCIVGFDIDILEFTADLCPAHLNKKTYFLGYGGISPGPIILAERGTETVVRFKNKVTNKFFPEDPFCLDRGKSGASFAIHNHGMLSMPSWDGWAEDRSCRGEYKDYVYPNSEAKMYWYHDHSLHVTAEHAYAGTAGVNYVHDPCDPRSRLVEQLPKLFWVIRDFLLDAQCQLRIEPKGIHSKFFFGDINTVNGVPWPVMNVEPTDYHILSLNPSISRAYLLQLKDSNGVAIHNDICQVIATDDGYRPYAVKIPPEGLMSAQAERYQVVCDFRKYSGQTIYLMNGQDDKRSRPQGQFCKTHMIAKIIVSNAAPDPKPSFVFPSKATPENIPKDLISDAVYAKAMQLVAKQQAHRSFHFGRSGGIWTINNIGWMDQIIQAPNVGRDTWEVWHLKSGGGWWHPVHVHLVNFFCLQRNGAPCQPYEQMGAKDVIVLDPSAEIYLLARYGPHLGPYMFHCHNLIHEDEDMMSAFNIVSADTGLAVNPDFLNTGPLAYTGEFSNPTGYPAQPMGVEQQSPITSAALKAIYDRHDYRIFYPDCKVEGQFCVETNPWRVPQKLPNVDQCVLPTLTTAGGGGTTTGTGGGTTTGTGGGTTTGTGGGTTTGTGGGTTTGTGGGTTTGTGTGTTVDVNNPTTAAPSGMVPVPSRNMDSPNPTTASTSSSSGSPKGIRGTRKTRRRWIPVKRHRHTRRGYGMMREWMTKSDEYDEPPYLDFDDSDDDDYYVEVDTTSDDAQ